MRWPVPALLRGSDSAAAEPDAITGFWKTAHGEAIIGIRGDGDHYVGHLAWLPEMHYPIDDPLAGQPVVDRHNPDPALRSRPLIGLPLLTRLSYQPTDNGRAKWENGLIYDVEHGKYYACSARLADSDHLQLHGYVGIQLLGRTTTWTRVDDPDPPYRSRP